MITREIFGKTPHGETVYAYTLSNDSIASTRILNLGGIIQRLLVADKNGTVADVVCGFDNVNDYFTANEYHGALIGRYSNRIKGGRFTLEGTQYTLAQNNGNNHLHGGLCGFDKRIWNVREAGTDDEPSIVLTLVSGDGDEGYPGTLSVSVTYTLTKRGSLSIAYHAVTDKTTILNMTNHSYFNLHGYECGDCTKHTLQIHAESINSVDTELIPDGTLLPVAGTDFDLSCPRNIGEIISSPHPLISACHGLDHNFIFPPSKKIELRAVLGDPASGRYMDVYTDQPCMQVYTGNMVNECEPPFKNGVSRRKHCAVCLETQAMPDSINHEGFTNVILRPGETFERTTVYAFRNE